MIFSKFQVAIVTTVVCALAGGLGWQIRNHSELRLEAARQSDAAAASATALEQQIAVQSQRAAAAEASVDSLMATAKQANSVPPAPRDTNAPIDTEDAVKIAMARATQLIAEGKQQEALDEYVKCYRELQAIRPGSPECQRLMSAIRYLGRSYPAALSALAGLRDSAMAQLQTQPGQNGLTSEIALLNERLGEGSRTVALYDSLPADDPGRQSLAMIANRSFIEARRYADALIGKRFGQMLNQIGAGSRQIESQDASRQAAIRETIVNDTLTNIEILTGAGKLDDARLLTEKLLAFDSSEATRAKLKQHVDRAQASKP
jgi:hypothetical protein